MLSNGYDPNTVSSFVTRIEALQEQLAGASDEIRGLIKGVIREAESKAGVPPKALRMALRRRAFDAKVDALAPDDSRALEHLEAALAELDAPAPHAAAPKPPVAAEPPKPVSKGPTLVAPVRPRQPAVAR